MSQLKKYAKKRQISFKKRNLRSIYILQQTCKNRHVGRDRENTRNDNYVWENGVS